MESISLNALPILNPRFKQIGKLILLWMISVSEMAIKTKAEKCKLA